MVTRQSMLGGSARASPPDIGTVTTTDVWASPRQGGSHGSGCAGAAGHVQDEISGLQDEISGLLLQLTSMHEQRRTNDAVPTADG